MTSSHLSIFLRSRNRQQVTHQTFAFTSSNEASRLSVTHSNHIISIDDRKTRRISPSTQQQLLIRIFISHECPLRRYQHIVVKGANDSNGERPSANSGE